MLDTLHNSKYSVHNNAPAQRESQDTFATVITDEPQPNYHYSFFANVPQQQQQQRVLITPSSPVLAKSPPPAALQAIYKPQQQPIKQFKWIASKRKHSSPPATIESPITPATPSSESNTSPTELVPHAAKQSSLFMVMVKGFLAPPTNKQPGGSDNNGALPEHVIRVQTSTWRRYSYMILHCDLMGATGGFVGRLASQNVACTGYYVDILFDSLIVRHASHNWGKKFLLRFCLYDPSDPETCHDYVESSPFETITKRGVQKIQQKETKAKKKEKLVKSVQYMLQQHEQKQVVVPPMMSMSRPPVIHHQPPQQQQRQQQQQQQQQQRVPYNHQYQYQEQQQQSPPQYHHPVAQYPPSHYQAPPQQHHRQSLNVVPPLVTAPQDQQQQTPILPPMRLLYKF